MGGASSVQQYSQLVLQLWSACEVGRGLERALHACVARGQKGTEGTMGAMNRLNYVYIRLLQLLHAELQFASLCSSYLREHVANCRQIHIHRYNACVR